jgi:hypothetical protein
MHLVVQSDRYFAFGSGVAANLQTASENRQTASDA